MITRNFTAQAVALVAILSLNACAKNAPPASDASAEADTTPEPEAEDALNTAPLAPVVANSESHYVDGVAGGVMVSSVQLEAEVVSVDQEKREAVLRGPAGKEVTVRVGKDAVNFYQITAGDRVNVTMARELVIFVPESKTEGESESEVPDGTVVAAAGAEKGASPAGAVVASSKVTSKITAMDLEARTATLTFEDGTVETFKIRPDVDMTKYKVGQEVVFLITEMLALEVKKL